jgi:DNA invertase Pin-like site-specific DNA recombinase
MMIIAYTRVSSETQTLDQQKKAINEYAAAHNLTVDRFIEDFGISAYRKTFEAREGLLEVLNLAEQDVVSDLILFESSRLSRRYGESVSLIERLTMKGVRIHSIVDNGVINQNDIDSLMNAFRSYMNQQSSKLTSERIKAKLAHLKQQGLYTGGSTLWGFTVVDKRVVPDEELRPVITQFFKDYIAFGTAYCLDKYKINNPVTLNKRIKNEAYKEIVDEDLWQHANKVRASRACRKSYSSKTNRSKWLFEGLLTHCCGKKLYLSSQADGPYYRCYRCNSQRRKLYKAPMLEKVIQDELMDVFANLSYEKLEEQYLLKTEKLKLVLELEVKSLDTEIEAAEKQLNTLKSRLTHFLCEDGSDMVINQISELITNKVEEIASLKTDRDEAMIRLSSTSNKEQKQMDQIRNLLDAKDIYLNASIEGKKSVLHLIVDRIIVSDYDDIEIFLHI